LIVLIVLVNLINKIHVALENTFNVYISLELLLSDYFAFKYMSKCFQRSFFSETVIRSHHWTPLQVVECWSSAWLSKLTVLILMFLINITLVKAQIWMSY